MVDGKAPVLASRFIIKTPQTTVKELQLVKSQSYTGKTVNAISKTTKKLRTTFDNIL